MAIHSVRELCRRSAACTAIVLFAREPVDVAVWLQMALASLCNKDGQRRRGFTVLSSVQVDIDVGTALDCGFNKNDSWQDDDTRDVHALWELWRCRGDTWCKIRTDDSGLPALLSQAVEATFDEFLVLATQF